MELVIVAPLTKIKKTGREIHLSKRMMCFDCDILRLRCQLCVHPVRDIQLVMEKGRGNQHGVMKDLCQNSLYGMIQAEARIQGVAE